MEKRFRITVAGYETTHEERLRALLVSFKKSAAEMGVKVTFSQPPALMPVEGAKLTPEDVKWYIAEKGNLCPYCECPDLEPEVPYQDEESPIVQADVVCMSCGKQWTEVYYLSDVIVRKEGAREGTGNSAPGQPAP
jgi:hypothetical protein